MNILEYQFPELLHKRLSNKYGWDDNFIKGVLDEYRKFLFLGSQYKVTPSEIIDEVWHSHLLFSKDYRNVEKILGKEFNHEPGDNVSFKSQYNNTIDLYRQHFGEPPAIYWRKMPFKEDLQHFISVNKKLKFTIAILLIAYIYLIF